MSSKSSFTLSPVAVLATAAAVVIGALAYRHYRKHSGHSHGHEHGHGHSGHSHDHAHGHAHSHGGGAAAAGAGAGGDDVSAREAAGDARFSSIAETYDSNPSLKFVNAKIVEALTTKLPFALDPQQTDVMEFGCGTGAVTMAIASKVRSVVALDAADGMIAAVQKKVAAANVKNVTPVLKRIERVEDLPPAPGATSSGDRFDVIFSTLAFHHLSRPDEMMKLFKQMLKPGGVVVITDLIDNERTVAMMKSAATHPDASGHRHAHGGADSGHSHGGGHGHPHGGGGGGHGHSHGHSHGGGADHKHGAGSGDGGGDTPTDVFHTGFKPEQFRRLPAHCGLTLHSIDAPYFSVEIFGVTVDLFVAVARKDKPADAAHTAAVGASVGAGAAAAAKVDA